MPSPLAPFRTALAATVAEELALPRDIADSLERQIRIPDAGRGDFALPCFVLANHLKQSPPEVTQQVAAALAKGANERGWAKVEAVGPYVNVTLAVDRLAKAVVPGARDPAFGTSREGAGKRVVIDFSSPNIAKPLAFHHIRSTVIGAAIGRLHAARGFEVIGINYLGDWGKQFGLLATGFRRHGDRTRRSDAKHLIEVYVRANQEADVASKRAAIARPDEARMLVERRSVAKTEKDQRSLAKKVRAMRGIEDASVDPFAGVESWLADLDAARKTAEGELEATQARDMEARSFLKSMEEGDPIALAEWREFRETSIAEFERVYARMGIEFSSLEGESTYTAVLENTLERIREKPGTRISDGAEVVDLPYKDGEPPVLVKTRDGTTLYITRDVAAAIHRHDRFQFERSLYVVAADQSLHFEQLFRTLTAMGFAWSDRMRHVPFGRVHGMSTRRGSVVFLDEVLDESVRRAREICEASDRIDKTRLDDTVEAIGVGSVVFGDLRTLRGTDYSFDWNDVLSFDGYTGAYVQFSHARACSIIRKGGGVPIDARVELLLLPEERAVMSALARYPDAVEEACESSEPSLVTRALYELAQTTAHYLTAGNKAREKRVLVDDEPELRAARLHLIDAVRNTLAAGLTLLGVRAPDAM